MDQGAQSPAESGAEAFGRYLARERELRGITIEHVAEVTRISVENLRALEEGRLERLPGRVFVVGYIRGYSKCIGLSADDAVLHFQERMGAENKPASLRPAPHTGRGRVVIVTLLLLAAAAAAVWLFRR